MGVSSLRTDITTVLSHVEPCSVRDTMAASPEGISTSGPCVSDCWVGYAWPMLSHVLLRVSLNG